MEKELIDNFNETSMSFLDFISTLCPGPKLEICKKLSKNIIQIEPNKLIEQFIVYMLEHYDYVISKDEDYFNNYDLNKIDNQIPSLFNLQYIKHILLNFSSKEKNLCFEYLIILSNYAKQYFKLKYSES